MSHEVEINQEALDLASSKRVKPEVLRQMIVLRASGLSLRVIGGKVGCCMELVRKYLSSYEEAVKELGVGSYSPAQRSPLPLPVGHPVAVEALWFGLERWRGL